MCSIVSTVVEFFTTKGTKAHWKTHLRNNSWKDKFVH